MKEEFLKSRYIHCDETRIQVIDEPEQKGSTKNWMWVYLTDEFSESPRMVLFDYERTRAGYHPSSFLGDAILYTLNHCNLKRITALHISDLYIRPDATARYIPKTGESRKWDVLWRIEWCSSGKNIRGSSDSGS